MKILSNIASVFNRGTEKRPDASAKDLPISIEKKPLPPLPQNGTDNFKKFLNNHSRSNSVSSTGSGGTAPIRSSSYSFEPHGQQSSIKSVLQASSARIDRSTGIDWDDFASRNPEVEEHVRAIQKISTALNAKVIENMTKQIQPLSQYIEGAQKRNLPEIEHDAKQQTRKGFKERVQIKSSEKRKAKREDIIQNRLDEVREDQIKQMKDSVIRLEGLHPAHLEVEFQMYFRGQQFKDGVVPKALEDLQEQLVQHATNVITGKLSESPENTSSIYAPGISSMRIETTNDFRSEPTIIQNPLHIPSPTPVLSTLNSDVINSIASDTSVPVDPRSNKPLPPGPEGISRAIQFLDGDKNAHIKDFLSGGTLVPEDIKAYASKGNP